MESSVLSIATGKNINAVGDFLKGESIANSFLVQSSALQSNLSTIRNGMSLAEKADKILGNSESMLQSMRELAIKSSNGTYLPRTGAALYSKAVGGFNVTAGSPGTFASGSIALTGATEGTRATGSLSFSGASAGTVASANFSISGAVAGVKAANTLTIAGAVDGTNATGTIQISGGTAGAGNTIDSITLDGANILSSAVTHNGNNSSTAANVLAGLSASGYNATRSGNTITLTSTTKNEAQNGTVLSVSTSGNASASANNINGANNASQNTINGLTVNGNDVLGGATLNVTGGTNAIATAIRGAFSSSGHAVSGSGANVTITSNTKNAAENSHAIVVSMTNAAAGVNAANTLTIGSAVNGTNAQGSIQIIGGSGAGDKINSITIDGGSNILGSVITHTGNNNSTAAAVASAISISGYTATSSGANVLLTSTTKDSSQNGGSFGVLAVTTSGSFGTAETNIQGGVDASQTRINGLTVNGNDVLGGATLNVTGGTNAIATAIRGAFSSSGHAVSGSGANVTITSNTKNAAENTHAIAVSMANVAGATATSNDSGLTLTGGVNAGGAAATSNDSGLTLTGGVTVSQTTINTLKLDGSNVLTGAPLSVTGDSAAVASAIRAAFSSSGHAVSGSGTGITITSSTKDTSQNDDNIILSMSNNSGATATSDADASDGLTLSNGETATTTTVSSVTIADINGGNNLIDGSGSVTVTGDSNAIATAVAARLRGHSEFVAYAVSSNIRFASTTKEAAQNGDAIGVTTSHGGGASTTSASGGTLTGGDDTSTNTISAINVNGVNILGANVVHNGGNSGTATSIKNAINSNSGNSGYRAENSGTSTITITATNKDTTDNGYVIAMTKLNNGVALNEVAQGTVANFSGGLTPNTNAFTDISVNGQKINGNIIAHTGNNSAAAAAIASDINATNTEVTQIIGGEPVVLSRNYTATSAGAKVNIFSDTVAYWEDNDKSLTVTTRGDADTDNNNATSTMDGSLRLSGGAVVYINNEIKDIIKEVDNQLLNAQHNKQNLFTGNTISIHSGTSVQDTISAPTYTYNALDTVTLDLTVNAAETSIAYIDTTLNSLRNVQSQYAAFANRLEFEVDYIAESLLQNTQTLSKIVDADVAVETSRLVKYQFLEDAALSMYMQTRMQKRDVMNLYFSQSKVEGQGKFYF